MKKIIKVKKMFSLGDYYEGKCQTVGLVVKDVQIAKTEDKAAMLFISLYFDGKLVEAQVPLSDTPDFKRHILSIIDQASKLKTKKVKDGTK